MVAKKTARGTAQADPAVRPAPEETPPAGKATARKQSRSAPAKKTAATRTAGTETAEDPAGRKAAPEKAPTAKAAKAAKAGKAGKAGKTANAESPEKASGRVASGPGSSADGMPSESAAASAAGRTPAKKAAARRATGGETGQKAVGEGTAAEAAEQRGGAVRTSGSTQDVAGHSAADDAGAADAAAQTGVTTVGAKKTPGPAATAAKTAVPKARIGLVEPGELAVRPGEEPWTAEEAEEARAELMSEVLRLREEITHSEQALAGLMRDSGDGAGDDDADTGTKNITREHELSLAANAREMLSQFERALQRLDTGTYGLCENCGNAIGKARMQAFPRATLCVECKQKQERRY